MIGERHTSVIVVDYNSGDDTARLVESLGRVRHPERIHVTIVDNVGDEHSSKRLNQLIGTLPHLRLLKSPVNLGYLGGFNYGLAGALASSDAWLVLCNADIIFTDPDFFDKLNALKFGGDVICIAPSIVTRTGRNQNPFLMRPPSRMRMRAYDLMFGTYLTYLILNAFNDALKFLKGGRGRKISVLPKNPIPIYAPHGACIILHKRYFDNYERLDDTLLIWGEEPIIAETVRQMDGRIIFVPELEVLHNESGGISSAYRRYSHRTYRRIREVHRYLVERYIGWSVS